MMQMAKVRRADLAVIGVRDFADGTAFAPWLSNKPEIWLPRTDAGDPNPPHGPITQKVVEQFSVDTTALTVTRTWAVVARTVEEVRQASRQRIGELQFNALLANESIVGALDSFLDALASAGVITTTQADAIKLKIANRTELDEIRTLRANL